MPVSREQVFNDIKKYGIEEVKKKVAKMNPVSAPVYDSHIKYWEEFQVSKRREDRESESLSISRKALFISIGAIIIAIYCNYIKYYNVHYEYGFFAAALFMPLVNGPVMIRLRKTRP